MTVEEKVRILIGDLIIRNISLDDQVTKLTERLAKLENPEPEKKE